MLLYSTLGTNDLPRALAFYAPLFAALEVPRLPDWDGGWAGWGEDYDHGFSFCLCPPFDGQPASAGNGTMLALRCASGRQVRAAFAAGLGGGGTSEGAPGLRPQYSEGFYAAYLRDPDGNKLALVFHRYQPADDTP